MCDGVASWLPVQFCSVKSCNTRESCLVFGQIYIAGPQLPGVLFFIFLRGAEALGHPKARGGEESSVPAAEIPNFAKYAINGHPHCKNNVKGNGQECPFHTCKSKAAGRARTLHAPADVE